MKQRSDESWAAGNMPVVGKKLEKSLASQNDLILAHPVAAVVVTGVLTLSVVGALPATLYKPGARPPRG